MGRQQIALSPAAGEAARIFGQLVRFARHEKGWTATELAARAGVSARTVTEIEKGSPAVSLGNAFNVAVRAGVPLFQVSDTAELARLRRSGEQRLALLPQTVRHPQEDDGVYDF
jgi:transcriptional regulator with XRE-family HTH domain